MSSQEIMLQLCKWEKAEGTVHICIQKWEKGTFDISPDNSPLSRNAETSSGGQLWQEHEDHCKPTCLLLIFERNKEEQPKTLEIQIESEESEPTHLDLILPPFLRRDRPGES